MCSHRLAFLLRELRLFMDDVEQRLVDLADVVEERDALHVPLLAGIEVGRFGEDERITSHTADVAAGFGVIGVDGAEECLEDGGGESFSGQTSLAFAEVERATCRSRREAEIS